MRALIPHESITSKIYFIRGHKVMLDSDLAELYKVKAIRLREQVKRNIVRFPSDFMFQLNNKEIDFMVSQFAIPSKMHLGGHKPYAFTEHGIAMLSSVLKSGKAIQVNIAVIRAFVKLREVLASHKDLSDKLKQLEKRVGGHDEEIRLIFRAIKQMVEQPKQKKRKYGFRR